MLEVNLDYDIKILSRLWSLTVALAGTSSKISKEDLLVNAFEEGDGVGQTVANVLWHMYHPMINNYCTASVARRTKPSLPAAEMERLVDLVFNPKRMRGTQFVTLRVLQLMSKRVITGHAAIWVWRLLREELAFKELCGAMDSMMDRDLRAGTGIAIINAARIRAKKTPIPEFNVALGEPQKHAKGVDFEKDDWYASRKYDGVRCIAIRTPEDTKLYARSGILLPNFKGVIAAIEAIPLNAFKPYIGYGGFVIDGELALVDQEGAGDDFPGLMKVLRRKNVGNIEARMHCFDLIPLDTFLSQEGHINWSDRQAQLKKVLSAWKKTEPKELALELVKQSKVPNVETLSRWLELALEQKLEGLIVRKDAPYVGKRSSDIIKYKKLQSTEVRVTDIIRGTILITQDGKQMEVRAMSAAICEYLGNTVKVGSGWSVPDRQYYLKHPEKIIGMVITVEYMEETRNSKTGLRSLRFPIFKGLHGKERTT